MFFRRMFNRKDSNELDLNDTSSDNTNDITSDIYSNRLESDKNNNKKNTDFDKKQKQEEYRKYNIGTAPMPIRAGSTGTSVSTGKQFSRGSSAISMAIQLTPLWEHILKTRKLPDTICPVAMFKEFHERLRDPEWQVRQHALRVLVDVLVVMKAKADSYMEPLVPQIVENLGHPAPTVRKGALDCLRVYLAETSMPESIMLQILDIGLNQKITNEPFGGRLTCGVMLSLPALVQSTLHTLQRNYIIRTTIDMLLQKMGQVTHQEITLKVLMKMRELIGEAEFEQFMSHGAFREFELLCNVYGLDQNLSLKNEKCKRSNSAHWQSSQVTQPVAQTCWHSPPTEANENGMLPCPEKAKIIMETEIKINDDTLTMRILEAKDDECTETENENSPRSPKENYSNSLEDDIVCGRLKSVESGMETVGVLQLLSDSDIDVNENQRERYFSIVTPSTPSRTPKRVTFGGEVVKMRTPDSDVASSNNNQINNNRNNSSSPSSNNTNNNLNQTLQYDSKESSSSSNSNNSTLLMPNSTPTESKTSALVLEIPNDNTKPLQTRPKTAQSPKTEQQSGAKPTPSNSTPTQSPHSPIKRKDSTICLSPRSPFKRLSISPVDSLISPKAPHKEIEVLHNLQRDPSPIYMKNSRRQSEEDPADTLHQNKDTQTDQAEVVRPAVSVVTIDQISMDQQPNPPKTWEELDIVDYETLLELRSGNWRLRLQGIMQLEEALRSSENLALVQPCLASLLRTLLSSERNPEVAEEKRRLVINLITRLPLDNLEDRTVQILTGLCRQGGAGANRVCKALMQRLPPAVIVIKLISDEFLHAKSSRFRENALQMVMFALMTFPSTCFDTILCVTNAVYAALNRKRRVRQAAMDVLAVLGQISTPRTVMEVAQQITSTRDEGPSLMAAIKARLARKQLPLLTPDGGIQYTVRVPSPQSVEYSTDEKVSLDADIEWITLGVGSVSPTSMKRRAQKHRSFAQQRFSCLPPNVSRPTNSQAFDETFTRCPAEYSSNGSNGTTKPYQDDNHSYNLQHILGNTMTLPQYGSTAKKPNANNFNINSRRMVAKSCSDSSMDGRSSDSTYTNSSGGSGGPILPNDPDNGISGRFTRQAGNSRFPAMDLNTTYLRVHKPPTYYPGMGAYAHLQQQQFNMGSTYTKINHGLAMQQHQKRKQHQQQLYYSKQNPIGHHQQHNKAHSQSKDNFHKPDMQTKESQNDNENLDGTYTICSGMTPPTKSDSPLQRQQQQPTMNSARRFVNVEKFITQSNKSSQTAEEIKELPEKSKPTTPVSVKSSQSYSQKSTASVKSTNDLQNENSIEKMEEHILVEQANEEPTCSTPITTAEGTLNVAGDNDVMDSVAPNKWNKSVEVLKIEVVDNVKESAILAIEPADDDSHDDNEEIKIRRNDSLASLHSKTESIKTQLEDTPTALSRTQSNKSLMIEEEIEDGNSFLVVEDDLEVQSIGKETETNSCTSANVINMRENSDKAGEKSRPNSTHSIARASSRSPTIAELKALSRRNSMVKSMDSLYERPPSKPDSLDNTTETSSQSSQINTGTVLDNFKCSKSQHTPLMYKSKTSHFLKSRRISPVKQSIKMVQTELYPLSLAKFEKPREALMKTFKQLDESNWEVVIQGLKSLVRLIRHHLDYLDSQMHMTCIQLTRTVRNLRSQVARAACQAVEELFASRSKNIEQECDDLICALLNRTADTNRFIRGDATRALEIMCDNFTTPKVLNLLTSKGASHHNALVRTTTAKLFHRLIERLGHEKVFSMSRDNRDKFITTSANFLLEGSLETRSYAKSVFKILSEHNGYNRLLTEIIPARIYRNIEKSLKSISCQK